MHGVDPFELSDVIGLIYDAASDASAWPQLLERLGLFMLRAAESQGDEGGRERVMRDIEACLMPHVTRAQDLHIELTDLGVQRDGLEDDPGRELTRWCRWSKAQASNLV